MDRAQPFSVLNERLRPQFTTSEQIYSSLNRLEDRQLASIRSKASQRPTILPTNAEVSLAEPEDLEETKAYPEQDDVISDEGNGAELLNNSCGSTELNLNDMGEEDLTDDSKSISSSEEKDQPGELTSVAAGHSSESAALDGEDGNSFQRSYVNGTLPDLINSGKLLGRRRTLGHVSETLKEVRREVELSRRRSIKLKAQVDKLQENRDGVGWGQHRERVTEELQSILHLLTPLTESGSCPPTPSPGENRLDKSLNQLQNVARQLAISHTKQSKSEKGAEDSAILQQALRDRDEAIEKKKAMEAELLRSKTELMMLNNQLLEAVQKRLELALELETWREDVQRILHQQLQSKQEAEQAQKKPSRLGILRRNKQPPIQRPTSFPLTAPVSPTTNPNQIFVPRSVVSTVAAVPTTASPTSPPSGTQTLQRNWRDRLRRNKNSRQGDQDAAGPESEGRGDDGFQVVLLD